MSDVIIDLAARRLSASPTLPLAHPAGVVLPFNTAIDAAIIPPGVRSQIRSGAYSADLVRRLRDAVAPGDRVLVIGGGLGVVSTLVARAEGVSRVIVAEPNGVLVSYIDRVHLLNRASEVETVNGLLAVGKRGKFEFCADCDPRTSSLAPWVQPLERTMMVPFVDLNMILAEERISLIICDTPVAPTQLLAQADLGQVDRILLSYGNEGAHCRDGDGICTQLVARGYRPEPSGAAVLLRSSAHRGNGSNRGAAPANSGPAPSVANLG